jgi:hypothetical protein
VLSRNWYVLFIIVVVYSSMDAPMARVSTSTVYMGIDEVLSLGSFPLPSGSRKEKAI